MKISTQFIPPLFKKGRNREKFMSMYQRIARRDIDNTHKVNGIS